ncbi:hypothetical protein DXG01_009507 [Tephrocybe rancida]|nr:hypothetical protein DXG01_009507 [Tephrocybe rancida]
MQYKNQGLKGCPSCRASRTTPCKMFSPALVVILIANISFVLAKPIQRVFDLQAHRGGRGEAIENSLHSFAWGMIDGAKTLELDNGITKDGVVVLFHDQAIPAEKCQDTAPTVRFFASVLKFKNDPAYPYVGKLIANLTLAQLKTLDCGSKRLIDFPLQLIYPGSKIPTMQEVFDFVACADPKRQMQFNIESKIDPTAPSNSRSVDDFVNLQHAVFKKSGYPLESITTNISKSANLGTDNTTSPWLAGLELSDFPAPTTEAKVAEAAASIKASILSPSYANAKSTAVDPSQPGYIPFTTKAMVDRAHELGMKVVPWTVDRLNIADGLLELGVDGIITDNPAYVRRLLDQNGLGLAPKYDQEKVFKCLAKFT